MTVIEHLEELRRVLIISLIAWGIATIVAFVLSGFILQILLVPIKQVIGNQPLYFTRRSTSSSCTSRSACLVA